VRDVGKCIDYIMRDFVMSWFKINDAGMGISNDSTFLEVVQVRQNVLPLCTDITLTRRLHLCKQYNLTNVAGNMLFRVGHVNPLMFVLDEAAEALRQHVYW
jgi:hypothetical protein